MNKKLLVLVFVRFEDRTKTLFRLKKYYDIEEHDVFFYENLNNKDQLIMSFYIVPVQDERVDLKKYFRNATLVHKKKQTFYTINALNKLIEKDFDIARGNINYKNCKIDWDKYRNMVILSSRGKLNLIPIKRVFW